MVVKPPMRRRRRLDFRCRWLLRLLLLLLLHLLRQDVCCATPAAIPSHEIGQGEPTIQHQQHSRSPTRARAAAQHRKGVARKPKGAEVDQRVEADADVVEEDVHRLLRQLLMAARMRPLPHEAGHDLSLQVECEHRMHYGQGDEGDACLLRPVALRVRDAIAAGGCDHNHTQPSGQNVRGERSVTNGPEEIPHALATLADGLATGVARLAWQLAQLAATLANVDHRCENRTATPLGTPARACSGPVLGRASKT
mmetsp:Transcript_13497/g.38930  ORF Transcript_13497/g.38930 Transcript_13497/m.38930 type:complete len:253 (+) Transcript_13497:418-1176(+)